MSTRNWWTMAAFMAGIMLSPLNVMFTGVALPTMRNYFQVGVEQATWIGSAYFIPSVALMPFQSQLGNRWGVRRIYMLGLLVLAGGGLLAALAPNFELLLISRVMQGVGWSALYPLALILINRMFPASRQGEMMGIWESSVGLTTVIAPLIGGAVVQYLGWRSLYVLIALVAVAGLLLTRLAVPRSEIRLVRSRGDWLSGAILTLALILSLYAITRLDLVALLAGGAAWAAWVFYGRRLENPSMPPALFRNLSFVSASVAAHIRMLVAVAALVALPLFFEDVQGLSPSLVGSLLVIYSLFLFITSWPGGRWSDRAGAVVPGAIGYVAMIVGILLLTGLGTTLALGLVAAALAIRGIGSGLSQAPYAKAATQSVPAREKEAAAGLYGTIRYSGLAVGTALAGIFLDDRLARYADLDAGLGALRAYDQLWLLLTGLLIIGLGTTLVLGRSQQLPVSAEVTENGRP